ncbi:MAG: glutamine synthetase III [Clostridia bacterium]|nr:glutamine synthetase III [Clostridia bacterium]
MVDLKELFGSKMFGRREMKKRLPPEVYEDLMLTVENGEPLKSATANAIAEEMKNWAISLGATHYTHWFQPMTGITAEKHESFIEPDKDGGIILSFSGKNLIKGEPDASSFPSGGLRATFEARGYTAWDPTSFAFVKDDTLYIPTCFFSYDGSLLDKKTPLLKSCEALNTQAMRILKLFGNEDVKKTVVNVGSEQEYFLVDKDVAAKRPDLMLCGRTLIGAKPPKGQEMDDHYYAAINHRVSEYMKDLDRQLWEYGVYAKTKHNEVAPGQHELAPVYTEVNLATDQNQLTMEVMKSVAATHGMVCLLHEKPFKAVNGSGKHNNWSIATDTGVNLLDPGKTPHENLQFLTFLVATISAVDEYQDLLRASVSGAGNDHRLGANEAPPAIISIFLGDQLTSLLEAIENDMEFHAEGKKVMELGVHTLPKFKRDTTDRNRTSPFAFTGNKFEFRMVGSSASIASPNIVLNTALADVLKNFADELETAPDFKAALLKILVRNIKEHKRIIFNGNNYSEEWKSEAKARGLCDLKTTVDAVPAYVAPKNVALFTRHGVFNKTELVSRCDILLENYYKTLNIECMTLKSMLSNHIIPTCFRLEKELCGLVLNKKQLDHSAKREKWYLDTVSSATGKLLDSVFDLDRMLEEAAPLLTYEKAKYYRNNIFAKMEEIREVSDKLETLFPKDEWPFPTYTDLLYSVR